MPANPKRRRCSHLTKSGRPCRAWALRDSEPAACSAHVSRRQDKRGEQRPGFYTQTLTAGELADLVRFADDLTLDDEIALVRVTLRRLMNSAEGADLEALSKLVSLTFTGARTVARLLRDQRALSGEAAEGIVGAIAQALDELGSELGLPL